MNFEKYLISENKQELKSLYAKYKKKAKNDKKRLHTIIKNDFVNNKFTRSSNNDVDFMWSLYNNDFPS